jgi:hypothetical protein
MALNTYAALKAAVADWMARTDLSGNIPDWITLGEARLNRVLNPGETDATLTGVAGSRRIDISAINLVAKIALFINETASSDEREILPKADGGFEYASASGTPRFYAVDDGGDAIDFDCPLISAYTFRFRYRGRFALSDSVTSNWLLDNYPDVYLAATLMWGGGFTMAYESASVFKGILDEGIPEIRNIIARNKRAIATVDPALTSGRAAFNYTTG